MRTVRWSSRQYGSCSVGGRRAVNEDRAAAFPIERGRVVAVVADGMGGARAGDVASESAVRAFVTSVQSANCRGKAALLRTAFAAADGAIRDAMTPERRGMGSTLVAAIADEEGVWVGNIGDSRAVLVARDEVVRLSTEHSVVGEALQKGEITEIEALRHPERHIISRAIGEGDVHPDLKYHAWKDAETRRRSLVLLGTDGLFNFIGDVEILELAETAHTGEEAARNLVRRAIDNGSDDNVTAAAILVVPSRQRVPAVIALVAAAALVFGAGVVVGRAAGADRIARAFRSIGAVFASRTVTGKR